MAKRLSGREKTQLAQLIFFNPSIFLNKKMITNWKITCFIRQKW